MWRHIRDFARFFTGDFFRLHRLERVGYAAVGVFLLLAIVTINYLIPRFTAPPAVDSAALSRAWQHLKEQTRIRIIHPFDPNHVSDTFLRAMNLPEDVIQQWMRRLEWGHQFREATDLWQLPAMDSALWEQLAPALIFPSRQKPVPQTPKPAPPAPHRDLNHASEAELQRLVPQWLARRIIKYRRLLGGFVRWEQLREVYGLKPPTLQRLQQHFFLPDTPLQRIHVNKASFYTLRRHPYISEGMARRLVEWRRWNGPVPSLDTLAALWPADTFQRLRPYLTAE